MELPRVVHHRTSARNSCLCNTLSSRLRHRQPRRSSPPHTQIHHRMRHNHFHNCQRRTWPGYTAVLPRHFHKHRHCRSAPLSRHPLWYRANRPPRHQRHTCPRFHNAQSCRVASPRHSSPHPLRRKDRRLNPPHAHRIAPILDPLSRQVAQGTPSRG
jgi:hypothetical protein